MTEERKTETWNLVREYSRWKSPHIFSEIVYRVEPRIRLSLQSFYRSDSHAMDDAIQNVWIKVIKALPNLDQSGSFESFVIKVAINQAINDKREKPPIALLSHDEIDRFVALGSSNSPLKEKLMELIEKLPSEDRQVLELKETLGYEISQIATILRVSKSAVYQRLSRAKRSLKKMYEKSPID